MIFWNSLRLCISFSASLRETLFLALIAAVPAPFAIEVVDAGTGRGVPLVELKTVHQQLFVTDSQGLAAVSDPELMGQTVYFHVRSHGYEYPKDGFGYRGKALEVVPGGKARLELRRLNIAERLYRVTGAGIYRDSVLLARPFPIAQPLLNARVAGCDSVLATEYRGKIHWFWGDTNRLAYPLGNFHTTGATSRLPRDGGLDPETGVNFEYYVSKEKFVRPMAEMPGDGPTWLGSLTVLRDASGRERMYALYVKVRNALEVYDSGAAVWNDEQERFDRLETAAHRAPGMHGQGHSFHHLNKDGTDYVYFASPFPLTRVRAVPDAFADPGRYESFTCLQAGTRLADRRLDRDADGHLRYSWKRDTPPLGQKDQNSLIHAGLMKPEEALLALRDATTGKEVIGHSGSVYWNAYRQRWVLIAVELGGQSSLLGEVWFAEADAPTGPWVYARKIVSHDKYTFYNPKHHPLFDKEGGRVLFFEGTYTNTFSGNPAQTPLYDYNQVMYKLDLSDPRLNLPVAVYDLSDEAPSQTFGLRAPGRPVRFFALDRPAAGTVPVFADRTHGLQVGKGQGDPLFHALAAGAESPSGTSIPLYEFVHQPSGSRAYSTDKDWSRPGYQRRPEPICLVWKDPTARGK